MKKPQIKTKTHLHDTPPLKTHWIHLPHIVRGDTKCHMELLLPPVALQMQLPLYSIRGWSVDVHMHYFYIMSARHSSYKGLENISNSHLFSL